MAVGPTPPSYPGASIWSPHPKSKANARTAQEEVASSTTALNEQVARNQQAMQDAQHEADAGLEHMREAYDQAATAEGNNEEETLSKQRLKGYEQLRDLKRQQEVELNRTRREGERQLKESGEYYRDTIYSQSRKGEEDLQAMKNRQAHEIEYQTSTGQSDVNLKKAEHAHALEELKQRQDEQYAQVSGTAHAEYERMKGNSMLAQQQENEKFGGDYKALMDSNQKSIDDLRSKAGDQIKQIRQDTAQKLSAYGSRQSDPFYKMVDLNAELSDEGDHYVLKANIPAHEHDHVSVALKGNTLVLSGSRRNEEKLDLGSGKFKGTSAYQSFNESFPLAFPVDRNALTKEFKGNQVIITVPKSTSASYHQQFQAKAQPERVRAERPHFPGNLPGVSEETGDAHSPTDKKSGRTLT